MESVAAGDEVAGEFMAGAVLDVADNRMVGVEIMQADIGGVVNRGEAGLVAGVHQVPCHLGLAIDRDGLAAGGAFQVEPVADPAEQQLDAVMDQSFMMQPLGDADFLEQADGALFQHAGPNPRQHIVAVLALQDDIVDAVAMQQLAQQHAGRPRADDCYFCPQHLLPLLL